MIHFNTYIKDSKQSKVHGLSLVFLLCCQFCLGQTDFVTVQKIEVSGQKKTKERIILRELDFGIGDTIHLRNIAARTAWNQTLLMNTGLFGSAKFNIKNWDSETNEVSIGITVTEFWYIYPFPIIELSDRNFNEWWQTYNADLSRVNIGLRFYHINLTGRNDLLKLVTQFGFTRKYEVEYNLPGINKNQTLGIFTNVLYTQNKELAYATLNDTLQFSRDPETNLLERIRGGFGMNYRPNLYANFSARLNYHHYTIDEKVSLELNPDFFNNGLRQRYFSLRLEFNWDKRDIRPYPLKGHQIKIALQKEGFGFFKEFDAGHLWLKGKKYIPLSKKWSTELIGGAQIGLVRSQQPFYNYRGLGYGEDFIRGYELYVINGLDYVYTKARLRFELINFTWQWGKIMPIKAFRTMPVKWYLSLNSDFGYVNDPFYPENNSLRNELLWGGGLGLDILVFYDKVFRVEYSINRLGERGVFLHWELNF